MTHSPNLKHKV